MEYLAATLKIDIPIGNLLTFKGFGAKFKIKDASCLFFSENKLKEIDTKNFDTSQATGMNWMFGNCSGLTSLDVSNFNTSQVTGMHGMFSNCKSLASLDVSHFDTSKVTDMGYMFNACSGLTSLDLSNFDTSKVVNMYMLFNGCSGLISLDLSNWDMYNMNNISSFDYMFGDCTALKTITMKNCNQATIDKIKSALTQAGILNNVAIITA